MDYTATINYDSTTRSTFLTDGARTLNYDDTLKISIGTGFPAGATMQVSKLDFFNSVNGRKGTEPKGDWTRSAAALIPDGVSITGNDDGSVTIMDADEGPTDEDYYYQCTATDTTTGTLYPADPELIVKKKPGGAQNLRRPSPAPEV